MVEIWSRAKDRVLALMPKTGGVLRSLVWEVAGCSTERGWAVDDFAGGEFGGVIVWEDGGGEPAGQ